MAWLVVSLSLSSLEKKRHFALGLAPFSAHFQLEGEDKDGYHERIMGGCRPNWRRLRGCAHESNNADIAVCWVMTNKPDQTYRWGWDGMGMAGNVQE